MNDAGILQQERVFALGPGTEASFEVPKTLPDTPISEEVATPKAEDIVPSTPELPTPETTVATDTEDPTDNITPERSLANKVGRIKANVGIVALAIKHGLRMNDKDRVSIQERSRANKIGRTIVIIGGVALAITLGLSMDDNSSISSNDRDGRVEIPSTTP